MMPKRRLTKQRKLILMELKDSKEHLSADNLYTSLKNAHPELSLGTVYRNLNVLCEQGEIKKIDGDFSSSRFDGNVKPHHHFYCEKCEALHDVETSYCNILKDDLEQTSGHKVSNHSILFTGVCRACNR